MFAEQAVAIVIIGAGAARADKAAVLAQPCLRLIQIVSAALHLCAQMPDPILFGLAFIRFDAIHIFFARAKIALPSRYWISSISIPVSLPLRALLVKHTAPVGQMQGFCRKKSAAS